MERLDKPHKYEPDDDWGGPFCRVCFRANSETDPIHTPEPVDAPVLTSEADLEQRILEVLEGASKGEHEARYVPNAVPTNCCHFAVVDVERGIETCRVWTGDCARYYAAVSPANITQLLKSKNEELSAAKQEISTLRQQLAAKDRLIQEMREK